MTWEPARNPRLLPRARVSDSSEGSGSRVGATCTRSTGMVDQMDVILDRCAALDIDKKSVMACVRTPDGNGGRSEQVGRFSGFLDGLLALRLWLCEHGVTHVAMEATSSYWLRTTPSWTWLRRLTRPCNAFVNSSVRAREGGLSAARRQKRSSMRWSPTWAPCRTSDIVRSTALNRWMSG
jgi:hypothetical protein